MMRKYQENFIFVLRFPPITALICRIFATVPETRGAIIKEKMSVLSDNPCYLTLEFFIFPIIIFVHLLLLMVIYIGETAR
jgi:hypothetical protein